jgi:Aminomethyltransferase folate-binding domain
MLQPQRLAPAAGSLTYKILPSTRRHISSLNSIQNWQGDSRNVVALGHLRLSTLPRTPRPSAQQWNRLASSNPSSELKRTPYYNFHVASSAKMVPFAGYSMPVQYADLGVGESHRWTREKASIFDVSHASLRAIVSKFG